ncbi:MAG: hypothetical protein JSV19_11525 [Phycisphaerales bacterium]|nr:MAG: hypothetical protein JSV19_11525 [Phycisphaerales bacterium]
MSRPLITVKTLIAQAGKGGAIELPAGALVTPAAHDWLASHKVPVPRPGPPGARETPHGREPTVYMIGDAAHPNIRALLPVMERRYGGVAFQPCHGNRAGLLDAVKRTCEALHECSQRRAVAVIRSAAIVNCIANKQPGVRAAIAPRPSSLFGLVNELGINMLIIENERMSLGQMRALVDGFVSAKTAIDPLIKTALGDGPSSESGGACAACGGNGGAYASR